jgi:glycosyltransferase involved in cell wall biosynthesis
MKFSIVITTYNRLPFLKWSLESALNQTINCEIIVVDDASSDQTEEYIKQLGEQVIYHRNSINLGHSESVNIGVKIAKGEWIKLIDDDDYIMPKCIETISRTLVCFPEAVICSCQAKKIDIIGNIIDDKNQVQFNNLALCIRQEDIHYGMLLDICPLGTPVQVAFQKKAFLRSGGWDKDFDGNYDDINSWIEIAKYGDAVFVGKCLCFKRVWSGCCNSNISIKERYKKNILIKQKIYDMVHPKHREKLPELSVIEDYICLHWLLICIKKLNIKIVLELARYDAINWDALKLMFKIICIKRFRLLFKKFLPELQQINIK